MGQLILLAVERQPAGIPDALASTTNISQSDGASVVHICSQFFHRTGINNGIDVSSVIGNDHAIRVDGPNGFGQLASYVGIDSSSDGMPRRASYSIVPPGGAWTSPIGGVYTVSMEANQVFDLGGTPVPGEAIGLFTVDIQPLLVTNAIDSGEGSLPRRSWSRTVRARTTSSNLIQASLTAHRDIKLQHPRPSASGGGISIAGPGSSLLTVERDAAASPFRIFDRWRPISHLSGFTILEASLRTAPGEEFVPSAWSRWTT